MTPRLDPDSFGFLVTDLARLIRADLDRRILSAGIGVTPGEARTLAYAVRFGTLRQNILAERMGLEAMTLSTYLDRLEQRGLIERKADPNDRRAKLVRVTAEGDKVLESVLRVADEVRRRARGKLSQEDWSRLQKLLKVVRANISDQP
ncbi:MarR family winged helix-turn-helix transcriptional regulator [Chelativorans sp. M5D2P16]|uniref:MarR family winged helix-turn-helix transcriptional regulator n=1 Tax=Chelativorans sp. M5D2P16 TaxID=3095678 RepID=UPI002ACA6C70|nr:MarR family transcriptional regulator [Chelativorans sp. M5D2P16]MDZ5699358.1 MarR family transcriptional regulator [Chelativorans sp. M5D2P16]